MLSCVCIESPLQVIWFQQTWKSKQLVEGTEQKGIEFFLQDIEAAAILEEPQSSESSSSFPESRESDTTLLVANIMADEKPRRVTLEDYSSTSVP